MLPRLSRTEGRHLRRSAATAAKNEQEQTMTEAECNTIEQANRQMWIERQEQRWETPLKPVETVRAKFSDNELPF
jgi:hypothetical protein